MTPFDHARTELLVLILLSAVGCGSSHQLEPADASVNEPVDASTIEHPDGSTVEMPDASGEMLDAGTTEPLDASLETPDASYSCLPDASYDLPDAGDGDFVADQGDFANYHCWTSYNGGTDPFDGLKVVAQRTIYLNHPPPHGSTEFPKGTIIVKDTVGASTFAMVKRGDDFNTSGAKGWEWYEVTTDSGGSTIILWSGTAPPAGMTYGNTIVSCNGCHVGAASNDDVEGTAIQLSAF